MDTKQKADDLKSSHAPREAYVTPELKEFGPVGVLTQAGSMNGAEMGNMTGMMAQMMSML